MTLSEYLAKKGIELNQPIQDTSNNPDVPGPIAQVAQLTGNSVQYAMGPTCYLVICEFGFDPEVPGT